MTNTPPFDVMILGAGLAGLSAADAIRKRGLSCAIIDSEKPGAGASGAPMLLANPAAGRRARKSWKTEECFHYLSEFLNRVRAATGVNFCQQNGVIRPAITKKAAGHFSRAPEKYGWQNDWLEWFGQKEFSETFPDIAKNSGGLFVKKAFTVRGYQFLNSLTAYLIQNGCVTKFGSKPKIEYAADAWRAFFSDGSELAANTVIDATGYNQVQSEYWKFIPLHPVKGQTATFYFDEPQRLPHSISSLGYMAFMDDTPHKITVGSTYEHDFDHIQPDENGLLQLQKKLENTLPGLAEKKISVKQWASVRVTVPDRHPVIGAHPGLNNLYMMGALGSKGLLTSRFLAELLTNHIVNHTKIDHAVSVERFY